jgi:RNA polymerase sigma-70 factor (ECF subfamily)
MAKKSLSNDEMIDTSDQFEALYESDQPLIYRFMFWRTKDQMLAEDLTSNVFEKAWRTRQNFTGGSTRAWLYRIAHTTLIDYWRKKRDITDEVIVPAAVSDGMALDEALDRSLALTKMRQAVDKLPLDTRQVVRLRFIEGCSARQTAEQLSLSEANVRVIQYRALKKLRKYLGDEK